MKPFSRTGIKYLSKQILLTIEKLNRGKREERVSSIAKNVVFCPQNNQLRTEEAKDKEEGRRNTVGDHLTKLMTPYLFKRKKKTFASN
jgi:hypothetical protein